MTSTPVMGSVDLRMASLLNTVQTNVKTGGPDFKSFMNRQDTGAGVEQNKVEAPETVSKDTKPVTDTKVTKDVKSVNNEKTDTEVTTEDVSTVKEAVQAVEDVIEDELDVTAEEIVTALENLGLNLLSLLDPDRMPEIVTEITGTDDVLALATDPELYEALSNITEAAEETVENLTNELGISKEEFTQALENAERVIPEETKAEENIPLPVNNSKLAERIEVVVNPVQMAVVTKEDEPKVEIRTHEQHVYAVNTEDTVESKTETFRPVASSEFKESEEEFTRPAEDGRANPMNFAERLLEKTVESFNNAYEEVTYSEVDVQDIMNQMTESIRVEATPEAHEINIKLHPESLGSVSVKVSANNEGVLRAQFVTQNESVRAIVESQAIVLREALESKGVTVEAVEVLVQSHEFERNLSDQNRGDAQGEQPKRRGIRRINLTSPVEDLSETEEDSIVREMMEQNGNTIDYSV